MITLSIFDHRKKKKQARALKEESRISNAFASLKAQPSSKEETAKEFHPAKNQANRMSNMMASGKKQEEPANQTVKHDNGANRKN